MFECFRKVQAFKNKMGLQKLQIFLYINPIFGREKQQQKKVQVDLNVSFEWFTLKTNKYLTKLRHRHLIIARLLPYVKDAQLAIVNYMWKRTMSHLLWTFRARNFKSFLIQTALNLDTKIKNRTCNQWNTGKLMQLHVNRNQWEFPWSCSGIVCFSGKAGEQEVIRLDPVTGASQLNTPTPLPALHTP